MSKHSSSLLNQLAPKAVVMAFAALLMSGCSTVGEDSSRASDSERYVLRHDGNFVRIEAQDHSGLPNQHPARVRPESVAAFLRSIKFFGTVDNKAYEVFLESELDQMVPAIVAGLSQANSNQDIVFVSRGIRPIGDGELAVGYRTTTGRIFLRDRQLHVIFGQVANPVYDPFNYYGPENLGSRRFQISKPVSLPRRPYNRFMKGRRDWVIFEFSGARQAKAASGGGGDPWVKISAQLADLQRKVRDGKLSESEYERQRVQILQSVNRNPDYKLLDFK